jgi:hypothetical protein
VFLGLTGVACGGNTLGTQDSPPSNDGTPPSADDSPPGSADDPPSNSDDTPPTSSDDTPPGGADAPPGGGRLQQLCEDACKVLAALSECDAEGVDVMTDEICENDGCAAAAEAPATEVPCLDQIEALFGCIANLPDVCMPTEQQAEQCRDDVEAFSECAEQQEPIDQPNPAEMCTPAGDCECPTECASCFCENPGAAGSDACTDICLNENM